MAKYKNYINLVYKKIDPKEERYINKNKDKDKKKNNQNNKEQNLQKPQNSNQKHHLNEENMKDIILHLNNIVNKSQRFKNKNHFNHFQSQNNIHY